jgi:hypothetical protein
MRSEFTRLCLEISLFSIAKALRTQREVERGKTFSRFEHFEGMEYRELIRGFAFLASSGKIKALFINLLECR